MAAILRGSPISRMLYEFDKNYWAPRMKSYRDPNYKAIVLGDTGEYRYVPGIDPDPVTGQIDQEARAEIERGIKTLSPERQQMMYDMINKSQSGPQYLYSIPGGNLGQMAQRISYPNYGQGSAIGPTASNTLAINTPATKSPPSGSSDRSTWESQTINGQWMQKDPSTGQWEIGYNPEDAAKFRAEYSSRPATIEELKKSGHYNLPEVQGRQAMVGNRYGLSPDEQARVWARLQSEPNKAIRDEILYHISEPGVFDVNKFPEMKAMLDQYAAAGGKVNTTEEAQQQYEDLKEYSRSIAESNRIMAQNAANGQDVPAALAQANSNIQNTPNTLAPTPPQASQAGNLTAAYQNAANKTYGTLGGIPVTRPGTLSNRMQNNLEPTTMRNTGYSNLGQGTQSMGGPLGSIYNANRNMRNSAYQR